MKKFLSVLLSFVILFSMFSVTAVAKTMSKTEVMKLYHSLLEQTAKKNKVVLVKNTLKSKNTADFSPLSGNDLKKTEKEFSYCTGEWTEEAEKNYLSGVKAKGEKAKETELYDRFELYDITDYYYTIKSAKYADNKITIILSDSTNDEHYTNTRKIVAELTGSNVIKKIIITDKEVWTEYSVLKEVPFKVTYDSVNTHTFVYDKVPAKSLTLSAVEITMGYRDTEEITFTVGPENATYKDVYIETVCYDDMGTEIIGFGDAAYAWEENRKIYVEGFEEGKITVNVYTYSGDILAKCDVTVKFSFFDRIRLIFDNFIFALQDIFLIY